MIEFDLTDGTDLNLAKTCYIDREDGGLTYERIREILKDVFGKKVVSLRLGTLRRRTEMKAGQGERTDGSKTGSGNRKNKERTSKFSLNKPVEQIGSLVAVHNLTEDKLQKALKLGGFPMPSIAIVCRSRKAERRI